jgi:predicted CopG family antitoxin
MTVKTIAVPESLYEKLKARKKPKETFSDLITRLLDEDECKGKHDISDLFGILGEDDDEWDEIEKQIYDDRLKSVEREDIDFEDNNVA